MPTLSPDEIARLSPAERLTLIEELWDSLDDTDVAVPHTQRAELERRLASFEGDREDAVSWDQLRADLQRRCP